MSSSGEMLLTILIIETTAAVMLAILAVSMTRQLREKTKAYQVLMDHWRKVEEEMARNLACAQTSTAQYTACRDWYRATLDNMSELVLVHTYSEEAGPGPFVEANEAACRLLHYDRDALLTKNIGDVHEADIPIMTGFNSTAQVEEQTRKLVMKVIRNTLNRVMRGKTLQYEESFRTGKGTKVPLQLTVLRIDLQNTPMVVWIGRDLTDIRQGTRALKEGQKRMEEFFSHSPLGIAMFDADRRLATVNLACLRMFGMPDPREFEAFNLFDNRFLPSDAKEALGRGESIQCEIVVDFDDVRKKAIFSSDRRGKGHFEILISNLGCDRDYRPRGYFAQVGDVTQRRKIEADLRRLQTTAAGTAEGISGSLEDVSLMDIMQVFCAGNRCMEIAIENRGIKARVFVQGGNITHCVAGDLVGEDAFYELMRWKQGKFMAKACSEFPVPTITIPAMSLLMEGARRLDEMPPA